MVLLIFCLPCANTAKAGYLDFLSCLSALVGERADTPRSKLPPRKSEKKYETKSLQPKSILQDNIPMYRSKGVKYYYLGANEGFRIFAQEGRLLDSAGHPLDGKFIYVMDGSGNIYAGKPKFFLVHHSSFTAGGQVAAAGELTVMNGKIMSIDRRSGHYKTAESSLKNLVNELRGDGADLGSATVYMGIDAGPSGSPTQPIPAIEVGAVE